MKQKPDPDGQNDARASWAQVAIDAFMKRTGTEPENALPDLLCDLMHWADRHDGFDSALDRARKYYEEETEDRTE